MVGSHKGIIGAFLIGGAIVSGAFIVGSRNTETQQGTVAVKPIERNYIEVVDTDSNGIPNWQEELQKHDPVIIEKAASSTYEAPTTVTGKFAVTFFEDVIRSKMYGAFSGTQEELIAEATAELAEAAQDELFSEEDIEVINEVDVAMLKAYGNHIAAIALSGQSTGENEAIILQDAVRYNNQERLADLEPIAASYVNIVKRMLETPVPKNYAKEHLDILNTYNAILEDIRGMQMLYEDPMYTFLRVKRYEDDVLGMAYALSNLYDALYLQDAVQWEAHEPATTIIDLVKNI